MTYNDQLWCRRAALFLGIFVACFGALAQDPSDRTPSGIKPLAPVLAPQGASNKIDFSSKADSFKDVSFPDRGTVFATTALKPTPGGVLSLTLDQAQQQAAAASSPLVRLGELQIEAARQHRLGMQAQYFPNLSSSYTGLHFNKHPGEVLAVEGPAGQARQVAVNIINKDQNVVNLMAVQPITPLMAIHQLVKIARADENIARVKAGMPVAETASKVEKVFFELLVAQRELTSAKAHARTIQAKWLTASNSGTPSVSTEQEADMISAEKSVIDPASKVAELTASLNQMLGLPDGTTLELVPPEPLVETISLKEATEKAEANAEVIVAEQTAIKAHAAATISKLEYGPTVAVLGGYTNQTSVNVVFPRAASYIGAMASWTIYDFGKREHGVKESKANADAADLGVQLVKAKVAATVKNTYFELERSRK